MPTHYTSCHFEVNIQNGTIAFMNKQKKQPKGASTGVLHNKTATNVRITKRNVTKNIQMFHS